ncbi:MAG: DUF308 domain-containing protein [Treponemataceae bacterium]|nr:DUF308 domain-containing protein [Treponemataceae bacterium]
MKNRSKIYMALTGLLLVATGIICLCHTGATIFAVAWLIGLLTLFTGVSSLIFYFRTNAVVGSGFLFAAVADVVLGIIFLCNNFLVASVLPFVFSFWVLFSGIDIAIRSADYKQVGFKGWWIILILGIAAMVLGIVSLLEPVLGVVAITMLVGIALILRGAGYFVALAGIRKFERL